MAERIILKVGKEFEGVRLDLFLSGTLRDYSRSYLQRLIKSGNVLLNGKTSSPDKRVRNGNVVELIPPATQPQITPAEDIDIDVLYEDDDLMIVNKPPGLVVHPAPGHPSHTLVNAILYRCGRHFIHSGSEINLQRAGIVHRLDKDTSGIVIVTKNEAARFALQSQFQRREIIKFYLAIVWGEFREDSGVYDTLMGRNPKDRKKFTTRVKEGRRAITRYKVVERYQGISELEIRPETGRTHQIRVHLSEHGHPLIGDMQYGKRRNLRGHTNPDINSCISKMGRQALHASRIIFNHPKNERILEVNAPLFKDMEQLLTDLRAFKLLD